MADSRFVYVTYIRTTPEKLWQALTEPEFTRKFWFGYWQDCAWTQGASWQLMSPDGGAVDEGEIVEIDPPRHLVISWRHALKPEMKAEGFSRMTYTIEQQDSAVKFTILHEMARDESTFIKAVAGGWPQIVSSLKSLLETGEAIGRPSS